MEKMEDYKLDHSHYRRHLPDAADSQRLDSRRGTQRKGLEDGGEAGAGSQLAHHTLLRIVHVEGLAMHRDVP